MRIIVYLLHFGGRVQGRERRAPDPGVFYGLSPLVKGPRGPGFPTTPRRLNMDPTVSGLRFEVLAPDLGPFRFPLLSVGLDVLVRVRHMTVRFYRALAWIYFVDPPRGLGPYVRADLPRRLCTPEELQKPTLPVTWMPHFGVLLVFRSEGS